MLYSHTSDSGRPWRQIAEEIVQEQDPRKVFELTVELNRALATQKLDVQSMSSTDVEPDRRRTA